jgi:hypothetical protein
MWKGLVVVLKVLNSWSVFDTPLLAASVTHALLIILRNGDVTPFFPRTFPFHGLTVGGAFLRFTTYSRVLLGAKLFVTEAACFLCQFVNTECNT